MSGHRRVKGVAYSEDDFEDFEDFEDENAELPPEDQEKMRIGKLGVRNALGSSADISDTEIEEALWYYYYDQEKTVSYLSKKHIPNKPKPAHRQNEQTQKPGASENSIQAAGKPFSNDILSKPQLGSDDTVKDSGDILQDISHFSTPGQSQDRVSISNRATTVGRLVRPSDDGKHTSKLASLSAARRKAHQDLIKREKTESDPGLALDKSPRVPLALLDRLGKTNTQGTHEPQRDISFPDDSRTSSSLGFSTGVAKKSSDDCPNHTSPGPASATHVATLSVGGDGFHVGQRRKRSPSSFAQAALGPSDFQRLPRASTGDLFTLKYANHMVPANSRSFTDSSPDDLIGDAQGKDQRASKSNKLPETIPYVSGNNKAAGRAHLVNVVEEFEKGSQKRNASFVVIGHVDHGKSTLMGRLLYGLSVINKRSFDKMKKEADAVGKGSFAFAWLMDSTSEERSRGVTIDVAKNQFETDETKFTVIDAPGHQDFVPNMISGVSQADFAMLVVDASTNAFEAGLRGQTKEHALLARSMGISNLVVAINKMDLVEWSQTRYDEIKQQLSAFLLYAGFHARNITFVPCSGVTGENVASEVPEDPQNVSWYQGPSLIEALENLGSPTRAVRDPLRMTVSDISKTGSQTSLYISGRIDAGTVQEGSQLLIMPSGEVGQVKGLQVSEEPVKWAVAGQFPTILLEGIDPVSLRIGDAVCDPENEPLSNVKEIIAKILAFEHLLPMALNVYKGSLSTSARISELIEVVNKAGMSGAKHKPRVIKPGQVAKVKLSLDSPLAVEPGVRIVLRSNGQTIAAGLVEKA